MRMILTFSAALAMAAFAWGAGPANPPAKKKAPAKKPGTSVTASKTPAKSVATKSAAVKKSGRSVPARPATTWRNRQSTPSMDRYKEIQDALVVHGYLPVEEANGAWGQSSADALKKFQADQTLESTGKINSLSLIALGLGPRHDTTIPRPVNGNYAMPESSRN